LEANGDARTYGVTTMYLDHQVPTWSLHRCTTVKYRLRRYDTGDVYLEQKVKRRGVTFKMRNKTELEQVRKDLIPIGVVSYTRTEFEQGKSRVTVDRNVHLNGRAFGRIIVEVKGDTPKWLKLPEGSFQSEFSKSSTMLGQ